MRLTDETGQDKSSLIRQLIQERWQRRVPLPTITEQLRGHPASFLATLPPGSAETLDGLLKARRGRRP
ncbi:MAG: hypothetical protein KFB97_13185 [Cyanobium sp. M30B3]|nr:MAG: hypothetical protein KFB97_13185 [Cyanobium sp. M30B3]